MMHGRIEVEAEVVVRHNNTTEAAEELHKLLTDWREKYGIMGAVSGSISVTYKY